MKELIKKVDANLEKYMDLKYPENIFKSMKYTVTLPGKRLRPVMCLEACRIFGGNPEDAMPVACAIEMLHAQSLIHDDLPCMDNDDFRRGKPSNHKVFGEAVAVLAGDALLSYGPQLIIEKSVNLSDETKLKVLLEYTKTAGAYGLIAGQVSDIESEGWGKYMDIDSKDELESKKATLEFIHTHKTADLFRLALKAGAIIAHASEEQLEEMDNLANKFGIAFQIYDDILDEISTFEELGKTVGKDKDSNKLTYTSLYGLEEARHKFDSLFSEIHDIIGKYNSVILENILEEMKNKLDK